LCVTPQVNEILLQAFAFRLLILLQVENTTLKAFVVATNILFTGRVLIVAVIFPVSAQVNLIVEFLGRNEFNAALAELSVNTVQVTQVMSIWSQAINSPQLIVNIPVLTILSVTQSNAENVPLLFVSVQVSVKLSFIVYVHLLFQQDVVTDVNVFQLVFTIWFQIHLKNTVA
jgi:hypothetical protein